MLNTGGYLKETTETLRKGGGETGPVGSWPWMASIGSFDEQGKWHHSCGGSVISPRDILTAGHCLTSKK